MPKAKQIKNRKCQKLKTIQTFFLQEWKTTTRKGRTRNKKMRKRKTKKYLLGKIFKNQSILKKTKEKKQDKKDKNRTKYKNKFCLFQFIFTKITSYIFLTFF